MALFVTKEGKRKSPMAVTCFFVDLLFCLVFGGMYALLTGVLHDLIRGFEKIQAAQQRGLARAGRADDGKRLAARQPRNSRRAR